MVVIDMDMPKSCSKCELANISSCPLFYRNAAEGIKERLKDCPIKCDIEDIRADIQYEADNKATPRDMMGYYRCLQIIDKHISGKEQK